MNETVPIVIGNHLPFRIVVRKGDRWNPTLRMINSNDYNYVKLARLSTFLDIDIRPFSLGISFDGSLILPAFGKFANREGALEVFNNFLGTLLLGGIYSEAVQPENISFGSMTLDGYSKIHGGGQGKISKFHQSLRLKLVSLLDSISLLHPKRLKIEEIETAYKSGKKILSELDNISPKLLLEGTSNFVRHEWAESLIFLWTSIEQLINVIWKKEILSIQTEIIIDGRKDFLKDHRSWSTSNRIELLFQKGKISPEVYKLLNSARKSRNDFVHNGAKLNEEKVQDALRGIFCLISLMITGFKSSNKLNNVTDLILKNQRGELFPKKTSFKKEEVSHWLAIPPLPGDKNWGNKKYEVIEDLILKPLDQLKK